MHLQPIPAPCTFAPIPIHLHVRIFTLCIFTPIVIHLYAHPHSHRPYIFMTISIPEYSVSTGPFPLHAPSHPSLLSYTLNNYDKSHSKISYIFKHILTVIHLHPISTLTHSTSSLPSPPLNTLFLLSLCNTPSRPSPITYIFTPIRSSKYPPYTVKHIPTLINPTSIH